MTVTSRGVDAAFVTDWSQFRSRGVTWGACKATEGLTFVDDSFATNWSRLATQLDARLAYHFAHPEESATAQVNHFLAVVKPKPGDVLVCDLERGTTQAATNAWTRTFLTGLRETGCAVGLYMGTGYAGTATGAGLSDFADFWWTARYPGLTSWPTSVNPQLQGNTTGWDRPHIWQWTDSYLGKYDANVSTLTAEQIATPGGSMALSAQDIHDIWAYPYAGRQALAYLVDAATQITPDQIAAAVIAKLPSAPASGFTTDQLKQAVKDALKEGVG